MLHVVLHESGSGSASGSTFSLLFVTYRPGVPIPAVLKHGISENQSQAYAQQLNSGVNQLLGTCPRIAALQHQWSMHSASCSSFTKLSPYCLQVSPDVSSRVRRSSFQCRLHLYCMVLPRSATTSQLWVWLSQVSQQTYTFVDDLPDNAVSMNALLLYTPAKTTLVLTRRLLLKQATDTHKREDYSRSFLHWLFTIVFFCSHCPVVHPSQGV